MKTSSKLSLALFLAAFAAAPLALAADPAPAAQPAPETAVRPRPGAMRRAAEHRMQMLTEKLNLTPEQQTKIKEVWKQSAQQMKGLRDSAQEDRRAKVEAQMKATHDQVRALLTPEQQAIFDKMPPEGPGAGRRGPKDDAKQ